MSITGDAISSSASIIVIIIAIDWLRLFERFDTGMDTDSAAMMARARLLCGAWDGRFGSAGMGGESPEEDEKLGSRMGGLEP
jgi:hypothetical protein